MGRLYSWHTISSKYILVSRLTDLGKRLIKIGYVGMKFEQSALLEHQVHVPFIICDSYVYQVLTSRSYSPKVLSIQYVHTFTPYVCLYVLGCIPCVVLASASDHTSCAIIPRATLNEGIPSPSVMYIRSTEYLAAYVLVSTQGQEEFRHFL